MSRDVREDGHGDVPAEHVCPHREAGLDYGATGMITGRGSSASDPAGCTTTLANGSTVTLTASPRRAPC